MEAVLPKHIPHRNEIFMSQKSQVFPLPVIKANESRYEECFDVLDAYEKEVVKMFVNAHGKLVSLFIDICIYK